MEKPVSVTALFPDVGGGLLTNEWGPRWHISDCSLISLYL